MNGTTLNVNRGAVGNRTCRGTDSFYRIAGFILFSCIIFTDTGTTSIDIASMLPLQIVKFLWKGLVNCSEECPVIIGIGNTYCTLVHGYLGATAYVSVLTAAIYRTIDNRPGAVVTNGNICLVYIA